MSSNITFSTTSTFDPSTSTYAFGNPARHTQVVAGPVAFPSEEHTTTSEVRFILPFAGPAPSVPRARAVTISHSYLQTPTGRQKLLFEDQSLTAEIIENQAFICARIHEPSLSKNVIFAFLVFVISYD